MKSSKRILSFSLALFGLSTMLAFADMQNVDHNSRATDRYAYYSAYCHDTSSAHAYATYGKLTADNVQIEVSVKDSSGKKWAIDTDYGIGNSALCEWTRDNQTFHYHGAVTIPMQ